MDSQTQSARSPDHSVKSTQTPKSSHETIAGNEPEEISTLVDSLRCHARRKPHGIAYTFLSEEMVETSITYQEIDLRARAIAALLQSMGLSGQRALLLYPSGLEFIATFMGCLYAGVVAVPAYPPQNMRLKRALPRLQAIARDAGPAAVLTLSQLLESSRDLLGQLPGCELVNFVATDLIKVESAEAWTASAIHPGSLAFLQYTSGSTALPKGVMVTHGNLVSNEQTIRRAFGHTENSAVVGWLPLYHDMGLIGNVLQPLFCGIRSILMSPASFLQKPVRWLAAISHYQATTSGGPNFAYELCTEKISSEERARLDLSSWTVAFNGAEPIREHTLKRFSESFGLCGFRPQTFYPCYGLAESTLIVSGGDASLAPVVKSFRAESLEQGRAEPVTNPGDKARIVVSCGRSLPPQKITIVNPGNLSECPPGSIGEIWVSGPSIAAGYWNRQPESEYIFGARTASAGDGPHLRTGDLGFLHEGELFVTGRLKDLIIIRGRNHYPQDIELTVEKCHPHLRPGCGAAFSVDFEGEERLVLAHEVQRQHRNTDLAPVVSAIREAVAEQHELSAHAIILLKPGSIPKTSSGKTQRHLCRAAFLERQFQAIYTEMAQSQNSGTVSHTTAANRPATFERRALLDLDYLLKQMAEILRVVPDQLDSKKSLLAHGLDSVMMIELATRIEKDFGRPVTLATLLDTPSIRDLESRLLEKGVSPAQLVAAPTAIPDHKTVDNEGLAGRVYRVSAEQEVLWLLDQKLKSASAAYNILVPIRLRGVLNSDVLQQSICEIVRRHEILRSTYRMIDERLLQVVCPDIDTHLPMEDLQLIPEADRENELHQRARRSARVPFDLAAGPLFRPFLYRLSREEHILTVTLHHIAADGWSVQLILRELAALYDAFAANTAPMLPKPQQYADVIGRRGDTAKVWREQLDYWHKKLAGVSRNSFLPADQLQSVVPDNESASHEFRISGALMAAVKQLSCLEEASPFMILLAAFNALFCRTSGRRDLVVGSSVANRDVADARGVVGPFTNALALRTQLPEGDTSFRKLLRQVRESVLEACAHQEVPFSRIISAESGSTHPGHAALFNVVLLLQNFIDSKWTMGCLTAELEEFDIGLSPFNLALVIYDNGTEWIGRLRYQTALFASETIEEIANSYGSILMQVTGNPDIPLPEIKLSDNLERKAMAARTQDQQQTIAIAATFTAEFIEAPLLFWMQKLNLPAHVAFAPYHQVIQQLLDPSSVLSSNHCGINVILFRFQDWERGTKLDENLGGLQARLERHATDLISALKTAVERSAVPYLVFLCPGGPVDSIRPEHHALYDAVESRLLRDLASVNGVHLTRASELQQQYPVSVVHDPYADEAGHVPFTREFFTALATFIARKVHAFCMAPYKVIVLDCDQTLWGGVCGEDAPSDIRVDGPWLALQQFMLAQRTSGMLLCLCSKNNERDVKAVFKQYPNMPLKLEHMAACRINWDDKSENLKVLSSELGLGLESFLFVDDNPIECAGVRSSCPSVLTLQLPENVDAFSDFLQHAWVFDGLRITEEDRKRTGFYRQNAEREKFRQERAGLEEFLAGLDLRCEIRPPKQDEVPRVAQLLRRTTQFNTTGRQPSEAELDKLRTPGVQQCLVVTAKDRFGDYGLIGTMLIREINEMLQVDLLALSCRALGRRIEYRMLAHLGDLAQRQGLKYLTIAFRPTERNRPALDFLEALPEKHLGESSDDFAFRLPVEAAVVIERNAANRAVPPPTEKVVPPNVRHRRASPDTILEIANHLRRVADIEAAIDYQQRPRILRTNSVPPRTPTEQMLAEIWVDVLRCNEVGVHDGFFELGGHSLLGTVVISRIRKAIEVEVPLHVILEHQTIAELAAWIEGEIISQAGADEMEAALRDLDALTDDQVKALLTDAAGQAHPGAPSGRNDPPAHSQVWI